GDGAADFDAPQCDCICDGRGLHRRDGEHGGDHGRPRSGAAHGCHAAGVERAGAAMTDPPTPGPAPGSVPPEPPERPMVLVIGAGETADLAEQELSAQLGQDCPVVRIHDVNSAAWTTTDLSS